MGLEIAIGIVALIVGAGAGFFFGRSQGSGSSAELDQKTKELEDAQSKVRALTRDVERANEDAEKRIGEAEGRLRQSLELEIRKNVERELNDDRKQLAETRAELTETRKSLAEERRQVADDEKRLRDKEANLDRRGSDLDERERELGRERKMLKEQEDALAQLEQDTRNREAALEEKEKDVLSRLERVAGLSAAEAKAEVVNMIEDEARLEAAKSVVQIETEAKEEAEKRAKKIIAHAIQRWAGDHISEVTVTAVHLPNDEMKGRIIGREGRNIRALEAATGVDLIIDDTPECITVSAFDPIRREVARIALEKLIADGRIHPGRIEEQVTKAREEVGSVIKKAGEQAIFDTGLHNVHPEIMKLIGRLKYRYSYGQNQWKHALETSFICGAMAAELGLNEAAARRAGLMHDIGKTMVHDMEGSHAILGAGAAKKYGEHAKIVHAIAAHHEEEKPSTMLAHLVMAADCVSGARPGARMENIESYVKRLADLERIASSFRGVEKSFAIQAGREVRVIASSQEMSDADTVMLARDIAKKIETDLTYPGQVKIVVIRETRSEEFAR